MTKKKRSPAQKLAREIQANTGKPYMVCLAEAQQRLATADGSAPPVQCPAPEEQQP
ncbi:hypothetical protein PV755_46540 [Streptomyces caniscabiei]|uniref:Uncharacterized protein n=1 Tax=Streptomyces caniscabiei TaxID=2746961 RepID=A0A927QFD6_9ACTN|nr:hypothetical protein [Streptomyces caniscabiei]MBD9723480.1 hypothetical protein [Streptomyces caniscabiei]MDX3516264.1 hypothetical protein [Streptomyces caniscabiei]MDX3725307.1 hypothetical protein [Streptomyces caniscabiei]WEO27050.1 hypothetical protein IHE65_29985 [Streptomyces caniscabiei]